MTEEKKTVANEISVLLDRAIAAAPLNVVARSIEETLTANLDKFRKTLPAKLQDDAERFIRRAIIYYQTADPTTKLHKATAQSFVMCVLEAAEIGLPLDGRLCHAVVYNNKKTNTEGREIYVNEATCMPDYKGLVAVAKRTGTISDIYAEIVCENDAFSFERTESADKLSHSYQLMGDRGVVIGCYVKVQIPNQSWRFEILRRADIDSIRSKSKAAFGPWKDVESSDWKEMAKKTAIKRILKGFMDDPGISRAVEIDDKVLGYLPEVDQPSKLTARLSQELPEDIESDNQTVPAESE